jgi:uncharacterized membrane protein
MSTKHDTVGVFVANRSYRNYAAVAADTFSSELGILATSQPRLITAPWQKVAPGTNGGVTATGITAGLVGSLMIGATATLLTPFCPAGGDREGVDLLTTSGWTIGDQVTFMLYIAAVGLGGSLLDSLLGAVLQASVVDIRTGKVIEGEGGGKVLIHSSSLHLKQRQKVADKVGVSSGDSLVDTAGGNLRGRKTPQPSQKGGAKTQIEHHESRRIATGVDLLSNNGVNLLMAGTMSAVAVVGSAWAWKTSLLDVAAELVREHTT